MQRNYRQGYHLSRTSRIDFFFCVVELNVIATRGIVHFYILTERRI